MLTVERRKNYRKYRSTGGVGVKFLGTDFGIKYIIAEINGKEVLVSFRDSYWKGIHSASFRINGIKQNVKIKGAYPGFIRRIQEAVILIKLCLMHAVNRITKRIC